MTVSKRSIAIIILALALIGGGYWWYAAGEKKHKNEKLALIKECDDWKFKYYECFNAPADTVFIPQVINLPPSGTIFPKPKHIVKPPAGGPIKDSAIVANKDSLYAVECPKAYYNDTIKKDSLYSVNIETFGCVRWMRVLGISLNHNYMIVKKNQLMIKYDTAWLPAKSPTFRIGPYVGLTLNSFSKFPGLELGGQVVVKDQLTVSVGGLYLDGAYANIRLGWLFKK